VSDYAPIHLAGRNPVTSTASSTITGGEQLVVTGDGTVGASSGSSTAFVGTALSDASSGQLVTYLPRGPIHYTVASGSVTAGNQLVTAASGEVSALASATGNAAADINNARSVVGVALTTASANAPVEWMQI
jgi:hypothetical protein